MPCPNDSIHIDLYPAINGWTLRVTRDGYADETRIVMQTDWDTDRQEAEAWVDFLYRLTEEMGLVYDKFGEHNVVIQVQPGHKHDAYDKWVEREFRTGSV